MFLLIRILKPQQRSFFLKQFRQWVEDEGGRREVLRGVVEDNNITIKFPNYPVPDMQELLNEAIDEGFKKYTING